MLSRMTMWRSCGGTDAGELPLGRTSLSRCEKNRERYQEMRHDMWKLARETRGARVDEVHRGMMNTAAATATPARDCGGLGARFELESEGNERGRRGLFIGSKMAGNDRLNRRQSKGLIPCIFSSGIFGWRRRRGSSCCRQR